MQKPMWGMMLQLGSKMWDTHIADTRLDFDREVYDEAIDACVREGVNYILLDLGEGLRFESHPELAIEGSWTREEIQAEQKRLKALGIDIIPKLNFSAGHDHWMGVWRYRLCTPEYYDFCADLIREVSEVFHPEIMHLGLEEEGVEYQASSPLVRCRQGELWWHDTLFFLDQCRKNGMIPAVWPGRCHDYPEEYMEKMPKDVIQFPYYYADWWDDNPADLERLKTLRPDQVTLLTNRFRAFRLIAENGYTFLPCGSNWSWDVNMGQLVTYCRKHYAGKSMPGFLQTAWYPTSKANRERILSAIRLLGEAKRGTVTAHDSAMTTETKFE